MKLPEKQKVCWDVKGKAVLEGYEGIMREFGNKVVKSMTGSTLNPNFSIFFIGIQLLKLFR